MPYEWYELVAGPVLQQGDILRDCLDPVLPRIANPQPQQPAAQGQPVVPQALGAIQQQQQAGQPGVVPQQDAPAPEAAAPPAEPEAGGIYDRVIVLSQSCDLADGQIRRVMVCPVHALDEFLQLVGGNRNNVKAELRRGRRTAYHLLNLCELAGYQAPHLVADFGDAFSIPLNYAVELAGNHQRVRLLPPYREHLAQMFARFYMRVGLPIEVAEFP